MGKVFDASRVTNEQRASLTLCEEHSRDVAAAMEHGAHEREMRALGMLDQPEPPPREPMRVWRMP